MFTSDEESRLSSQPSTSKLPRRRMINPNLLFFCQIALLIIPITILYAGLYFMNVPAQVIVTICGLIILTILLVVVFIRPFTPKCNVEDSVPLTINRPSVSSPRTNISSTRTKVRKKSTKEPRSCRYDLLKKECTCPAGVNQKSTAVTMTASSETLLSMSSSSSVFSKHAQNNAQVISVVESSIERQDSREDQIEMRRADRNQNRMPSLRHCNETKTEDKVSCSNDDRSMRWTFSQSQDEYHSKAPSVRSHTPRQLDIEKQWLSDVNAVKCTCSQQGSSRMGHKEHSLVEDDDTLKNRTLYSPNLGENLLCQANLSRSCPSSANEESQKNAYTRTVLNRDYLTESGGESCSLSRAKPVHIRQTETKQKAMLDDIQPPCQPPEGRKEILLNDTNACSPCRDRSKALSKVKRGFLSDADCSPSKSPEKTECGKSPKRVYFSNEEDWICRPASSATPELSFDLNVEPAQAGHNEVTRNPVLIKLIPTSSREGRFELDNNPNELPNFNSYIYAVKPFNQRIMVDDSVQTVSTASDSVDEPKLLIDGEVKENDLATTNEAVEYVDDMAHSSAASGGNDVKVPGDPAAVKRIPVSHESILDFVLKTPFGRSYQSEPFNDSDLPALCSDLTSYENSASSFSFNLLNLDYQRMQEDKSKSKKRMRTIDLKDTLSSEAPLETGYIGLRKGKMLYQPKKGGLLVTESSKEEFHPTDGPSKIMKKLKSGTADQAKDGKANNDGDISVSKQGNVEFKQIKKSRVEKTALSKSSPPKADQKNARTYALFPPIDLPDTLPETKMNLPKDRINLPSREARNLDKDKKKRRCIEKVHGGNSLKGSPERSEETKKKKSRRLSHQVESTLLRKSSSSYENVIIERTIKRQKKTLKKFK